MKLRNFLALTLGAVLLLPATAPFSAVHAQDEPAAAAAEEKKKDDLPQISKVTEGMEKREGFFHLWVDEKKDKLYAEIPANRLNKDFLLSSSLSSGQLAGLQSANTLWRIERQDDQALIVVPNTFFTASGELSSIVKYTYPDQVIATSRILGQGAGGAILIDLKSLLAEQAREAGIKTPSKITQVARAKSFPGNSVVELQFRGPSGGSGMYFNLGEVPASGFKSRVADPRVGYFVTAKHDFSKDPREDTTFERYINRWRLEKTDASLSLSPPKEPIVIYIEKTVPVKYRRWVKEGIESWNKAFEEIGFVGAIEVRQQTDTNQFKDYDPEDSRYNFFRWIASQSPFAIAPSRVDPRTGEILDSDILFDESMVRHELQDYNLFVNSFPDALDLSPRMRHWLAQNPAEHPNWQQIRNELGIKIQSLPELAGMTPEALFAKELTRDLSPSFHGYCSIGYELNRELSLAGLGIQYAQLVQTTNGNDAKNGDKKKKEKEKEQSAEKSADTTSAEEDPSGESAEEEETKEEEKKSAKRDLLKEWPEEFIGPIIREIVAHEFGHALGLRHNFKASSWLEYSTIQSATDKAAPTVGSVMDYNPFTMKADGSIPGIYITPTIGPYDMWAIEYGYAVPGSGKHARDENKMLKDILDKVAENGHDFGTDEDVASPDPSIARWDLGKNSLEYYRARVQLADSIKDKLLDVAVQDDESYAKARRAFEILIAQRNMAAANATKYIGGYYLYRDHKGDPNARKPIEVVPAARQREAMNLIVETLLGPDAIKIDPELQTYLAASRWLHRDTMDSYQPLTFPIQDRILSYQRGILFRLTNPERIQYVYDSEFHVPHGQDIYTLPEMFDALTNATWAEVVNAKSIDKKYSAREPMVNNLRRNLQREYLSRLINIATQGEQSMYPAVARTLAWKKLKDLGAKIDTLIADKSAARLDAYTSAHLEESSMRIKKALEAEYTLGGTAGGGSGVYFFFGQGQPASDTMGAPSNPRPNPLNPF